MIINYTKLHGSLVPIRYPLPYKESLFSKMVNDNILREFILKANFGKLALRRHTNLIWNLLSLRQYKWIVLPFVMKNVPSISYNRLEDMFGSLDFVIFYADGFLVCLLKVNEHVQRLKKFYEVVSKYRVYLSKKTIVWKYCDWIPKFDIQFWER